MTGVLILSPALFVITFLPLKLFFRNSELLVNEAVPFLNVHSCVLSWLFTCLFWLTQLGHHDLKEGFYELNVLATPAGNARLAFCLSTCHSVLQVTLWMSASRTALYVSEGLHLAAFDSVLL